MQLTFTLKKDTKRTFVFEELNDDGEVATSDELLIGTLYVQKEFFHGKTPTQVFVNISATDPDEEDDDPKVES